MRKLLILALVALLGPAALVDAQPGQGTRQATLMALYDLDGEAADADQIVTVVDLTNIALTIAAQPDVCRRVTITIVDTTPSITAGTTTVVGTDCNGDALTEVLDGSGGAGTVTSTGLFETITSVTNASYATLGGASDETITVGVAALTAASTYFCSYKGPGSAAAAVFGNGYRVDIPVTTSGASSTTIAAVTAATDPYNGVSAGDILRFVISGVLEERLVTAKASATSLTVDEEITIPTTGQGFYYKRADCGAGDDDGYVPVGAFSSATWHLNIAQLTADSGGVDYHVECRIDGAAPFVATVIPDAATGATNVTAAYIRALTIPEPHQECRVGFIFGDGTNPTADDGTDTGTDMEQISLKVIGRLGN